MALLSHISIVVKIKYNIIFLQICAAKEIVFKVGSSSNVPMRLRNLRQHVKDRDGVGVEAVR